MKFDSKPMLMQLAEPEFMCPKCGDKFYIYDVDKKPNKCGYCGLVFDWTYSGDWTDKMLEILEEAKENEYIFIPENRDRPIKMIYEDDARIIQTNDYTLEYTRKLSPMEAEKLFMDLFGTTDVGILDCSDMSDEEFERIVDKFNELGCTSFNRMSLGEEAWEVFTRQVKK